MICLTGDVHQEYGGGDQEHYEGTEFDAALEYVEIAKSYDIPLTLFLTGKVVEENSKEVKNLSQDNQIEIGGHTWNALRPQWLHRKLFAHLTGSAYGPKWHQKRDIHKTIDIINKTIDPSVQSWRTHSYESNEYTYQLLSNTSVQFISDRKNPDITSPYNYDKYDLVEFPINVMPDHEHLLHAGRTTQTVSRLRENGWSDAFGSESYSIQEWTERVIAQINSINRERGVSTLLIHPDCMKAADDFYSFERICEHIYSSGYEARTFQGTK